MKTRSEETFENFLTLNKLPFQKIEEIKEKASHRPDYMVRFIGLNVMFEVKELVEDEKFGVVKDPSRPYISLHSRIIGDHVRRMINRSKKQVQYGAGLGVPSILIIYNNIDPVFQMHGTENHDFIAAMCGEPTILLDINTREATDMFQGMNSELQDSKNTSFSAVGRLFDRSGILAVTVFENIYAKVVVPYDLLPPCFEVKRINVDRGPLTFA